MHQAIDILMNEHRVIEQVLGSLETFAARVRQGESPDRATVKQYADFFHKFADTCHHGKEEDLLFERMCESGFPRDVGPIAVMKSDHVQGRNHVAALAKLADGSGPLDETERRSLIEHATTYASMLRAHILKEDTVLYPWALRAVAPDQMDGLVEAFNAFERDVTGEHEHERYHRLAHELIEAYPPARASTDTDGHMCGGCSGHLG